ncbi:adenylate/guanylate cyclase domain-containing protein [Nocardioides terrisoli]|uniref:adenylate/guanylate cyclase domain-containing protein n=1 Tax=Nocardioides terrisoli TaxID=3388267 RepID=UPI00287B90A0|nr:adenylate/guanylate cyclase domain-containing protein [Nocardioides marmorisolisilvae]
MLTSIIVLAVCLVAMTVLWWRARTSLAKVSTELTGLQAQVEARRTAAAAAPLTGRQRGARAVRAVMETAVESAVRLREGGVTGLLAASIEDLARWTAEDRSAISRFTAEDGTVTILFSDIEDSTAINEQLGDDEWVALLAAHDKLVRGCVTRHHGHIVKSQGDGFMIVFSDPAAAVHAGIAIQDALGSGSHRLLRRNPIRVRVGIHSGTAIEKGGDFFGTNVAMAARVAGQAEGGEILVSDELRQALRGNEDIVLVDFREAELKGLPGVHRLWEVALL